MARSYRDFQQHFSPEKTFETGPWRRLKFLPIRRQFNPSLVRTTLLLGPGSGEVLVSGRSFDFTRLDQVPLEKPLHIDAL